MSPMAPQLATFLLLAAAAYLAAGLLFAAAFLHFGLPSIDHAATRAPWSFRLIILPGVAALWPFLLLKWLHARP